MNNFERFIDSIMNKTPFEPNFVRGAEIQKVLDKCAESDEKNFLGKYLNLFFFFH